MKIRNSKLKIAKGAFTLIEVLVAVSVFFILFLITMSFVNLAAGQAKSLHTKSLTTSIRHTFDTISQKMNNANGEATIGTFPVDAFRVEGGVLGIVNVGAGGTQTCTFIKKKNDGRIYMEVPTNCNNWPGDAAYTNPITDSNIFVSDFSFSGDTAWQDSVATAPIMKMTISARDTDPEYQNDNQITLQTSYTLDYLTIKKLQQ